MNDWKDEKHVVCLQLWYTFGKSMFWNPKDEAFKDYICFFFKLFNVTYIILHTDLCIHIYIWLLIYTYMAYVLSNPIWCEQKWLLNKMTKSVVIRKTFQRKTVKLHNPSITSGEVYRMFFLNIAPLFGCRGIRGWFEMLPSRWGLEETREGEVFSFATNLERMIRDVWIHQPSWASVQHICFKLRWFSSKKGHPFVFHQPVN